MKFIIILFSVLLMFWPSKTNACDDVAKLVTILTGASATLGSTIIFPLLGLAMDDRENPPYWKAVGFTFAASSAGAWLAFSTVAKFDCDVEFENIGYPVVFGAITTYLTYRYAPRPTDKSSSALWQYAPQVSVLPLARGGSIKLNWSF